MPKQWNQIINVAARFWILIPVLMKFVSSGDITLCDIVCGSWHVVTSHKTYIFNWQNGW